MEANAARQWRGNRGASIRVGTGGRRSAAARRAEALKSPSNPVVLGVRHAVEPMTRFTSDAEIVDGEPVPVEESSAVAADRRPAISVRRNLPVRRAPATVPARHAAALAATSFVAGAAAVAVVGRRAPRLTRRGRRGRRGVVGEILSSNSFLVDVHLVRRG